MHPIPLPSPHLRPPSRATEAKQCWYQGLSQDNSSTMQGRGQFPLIHSQQFRRGFPLRSFTLMNNDFSTIM